MAETFPTLQKLLEFLREHGYPPTDHVEQIQYLKALGPRITDRSLDWIARAATQSPENAQLVVDIEEQTRLHLTTILIRTEEAAAALLARYRRAREQPQLTPHELEDLENTIRYYKTYYRLS